MGCRYDRQEETREENTNLGYCVCTKGEKQMTLGFVYILEDILGTKQAWIDPIGFGSTGHTPHKGVPDPSCHPSYILVIFLLI